MTQTETITGPTLEEALAALCEKHDLTSFEVAYRRGSDKAYAFSATCHWDGFSRRNITSASEYGSDISTAVSDTIIDMQKDRLEHSGEFHVLPAFEVSA